MLKEESQWTWYLFSVYFKIGFLNVSDISCRYTLELPKWAIPMCTNSIYPFSKLVFNHKTGFSHTSQLLFMFQCNGHVEMNKFLCSLACTWMTIIDSQFYVIDSIA